jgi:hypothetical protein
VTLYVPSTSVEPIEVKVLHSGLRMVLVSRESIPYLDASWAVLGVYFLLGASDDPEKYRAYVGEVGKRTLLTRIKEHLGAKSWWSRALLIASASDDLNSAEIGWLEGSLYDLLKNAVAAEVKNKGRPGDDSLPLPEQDALRGYVRSIALALRAVGAPPDTGEQKPLKPATGRKVYKETIADLIEAGLLKPGTSLHPLKAGLTQTATVLPNGSLEIDGAVYEKPSPAAIAVSGSKAEAGWEFWGAPSGEGGLVSLFDLREKLRASPTSTGSKQKGSPAAPSGQQKKKARRFNTTLPDLLDRGLVKAGEHVVTTRKSLAGTAATITAQGALEFKGTTYESPSAAAVAASGKKAEAGWEFWAVERDGTHVSLYELRLQAEEDAADGDNE